MRKLILFCLVLILSACGKPPGNGPESNYCSSYPVVGTWHGGGDTLQLNGNCKGTTNVCALQFDWMTSPGETLASITVTSTNGGSGCMPLGYYRCDMSRQGDQLYLDCGYGTWGFTR